MNYAKTRITMIVVLFCMLFGAGCAKKETMPSAAEVEAPPVVAPQPEPVVAAAPEVVADDKVEVLPIDLDRIHFDYDQSSLSSESLVILAETAKTLQTNPELQVEIEGYCDNRGSDEYNLALGERRAQAAKEYLISLGVNAERLRIISFGEERPLNASETEAAWAMNRRAEFKKID